MKGARFVLLILLVGFAGCSKEELRYQAPQVEDRGGSLLFYKLETCKEESPNVYRLDIRVKSQGEFYLPIPVIGEAAIDCYEYQPIEFDVNMGMNDFFSGVTRYRYIRYKLKVSDCELAEQIGECLVNYLEEHKQQL